jgi:hypothetical protein
VMHRVNFKLNAAIRARTRAKISNEAPEPP